MAKGKSKFISLTVDHVHMPDDLLHPRWQNATNTQRYPGRVDGRRVKYEVDADMADFLIGRDQAIEVAPDPPEA